MEANIDDMNPEFYDYVEGLLFDAGARDVFKANIMMKKNRPAIKLTVLTDKNNLSKMKEILFVETTTLGIRYYEVSKVELERKFEKLSTSFGEITIKKGFLNGQLIKSKFEYEECKTIAKKYSLPIKEVYEKLENLLHEENVHE